MECDQTCLAKDHKYSIGSFSDLYNIVLYCIISNYYFYANSYIYCNLWLHCTSLKRRVVQLKEHKIIAWRVEFRLHCIEILFIL